MKDKTGKVQEKTLKQTKKTKKKRYMKVPLSRPKGHM
jgi:hypothetical protein